MAKTPYNDITGSGGWGSGGPLLTSGGYQPALAATEGPRIPYRGWEYTVTQMGREWNWNVYDTMGDSGTLYASGAIFNGSAAAAAQSAKDWIDNYIDESEVQDTEDDETITDFEVHSMYDCETQEEYTAYTQEDHEKYAALGYVHDLGECSVSSTDEKYEFIVIGLLAMAALVMVFLDRGDGVDG